MPPGSSPAEAEQVGSRELAGLTELSHDLHLGPGELILRGEKRFRLLPFLGPAFIACVAYIDPGNFATNIAGGAKFGYTLVWVIVASNLMAMLIQSLSAKLGIATGRNLPEVCRERFSHRTSILLWIQAELIAMATDLAEFLGAAIGFHLLLGVDLFPAAIVTGIASFGILALQRFGFRPLEAVIASIVAVIGFCYLGELFLANPPLGTVGRHAVTPAFAGTDSVLLAVGILGATVMPHVIYLHSALTQNRIVPTNDAEAKRLFRYTRIDVVIAMTITAKSPATARSNGRCPRSCSASSPKATTPVMRPPIGSGMPNSR